MIIELIEMKVHGTTWTPFWPLTGGSNPLLVRDYLKELEAKNTDGIQYRIATYERKENEQP